MSYEPEVDDYVIWDKGEYGVEKGWVYFKCDEYITIEVHVKPKPYCEHAKNDRHKMIHCLLLCNNQYWSELKYVRHRESPYQDANAPEQLNLFKQWNHCQSN
tara:strand:- start:41 stop:346 length:306 start_codon:yes stop_codon:yes gene_type:complete